MSFIDKKNISLGMLNISGIYLNENSTTCLVNNFCHSMNAWRDKTCTDTKSKTKKRKICNSKKVKKSLNVNRCNTDRPADPTVDNNKSLSRNNSSEERAETDAFPSATAHRLENAKNVTIGVLNVNFLRNKQRERLALCLCD